MGGDRKLIHYHPVNHSSTDEDMTFELCVIILGVCEDFEFQIVDEFHLCSV